MNAFQIILLIILIFIVIYFVYSFNNKTVGGQCGKGYPKIGNMANIQVAAVPTLASEQLDIFVGSRNSDEVFEYRISSNGRCSHYPYIHPLLTSINENKCAMTSGAIISYGPYIIVKIGYLSAPNETPSKEWLKCKTLKNIQDSNIIRWFSFRCTEFPVNDIGKHKGIKSKDESDPEHFCQYNFVYNLSQLNGNIECMWTGGDRTINFNTEPWYPISYIFSCLTHGYCLDGQPMVRYDDDEEPNYIQCVLYVNALNKICIQFNDNMLFNNSVQNFENVITYNDFQDIFNINAGYKVYMNEKNGIYVKDDNFNDVSFWLSFKDIKTFELYAIRAYDSEMIVVATIKNNIVKTNKCGELLWFNNADGYAVWDAFNTLITNDIMNELS